MQGEKCVIIYSKVDDIDKQYGIGVDREIVDVLEVIDE